MRETSRLVLSNDRADLARLTRWLEAKTDGLPLDVAFAVALCLEEAVLNIIAHGGAAGRVEIVVELARAGDGLRAVVEDDSQPFDPTKAPAPPRAASLEEARPGAFGIPLMRSFATGMSYERRVGRNRLTLTFARQAEGSE